MNTEQAREIIEIIEGVYPNFTKGNPEVVKTRIRIWGNQLKGWDYEITKRNLMKHIETSPYIPSIAEIKPQVYEFDSIAKKIDKVFEGEVDD